ncbi:hypothetical protein DFH08DRAFT_636270, partial [Mycena albidolilacea]
HSCGQMTVACEHCNALHWLSEKISESCNALPRFGTCCSHGKVQLRPLTEPPQPLHRLLVGADAQAQEFCTHITQYNAAFAFTSLGVSDNKNINRHGPNAWVFRILGQLCNLSEALTAPDGIHPSYSQLYMYDPTIALQQQMNRNSSLHRDTMESLQAMLTNSHPYTEIYKHAHETLEELGDMDNPMVRLRVLPGDDRRRYNLPTADEVAVVLPGDGSEGNRCDIILHNRTASNSPLMRISDMHPAYSPLYFVLLFPHREHGWHPDLTLR